MIWPRLRPLGVTVQGPDPIGSIDLRLHKGVDVLYGLNGAGKSRTLQGIAEAVAGPPVQAPSVATMVHVLLEPSDRPQNELFASVWEALGPAG